MQAKACAHRRAKSRERLFVLVIGMFTAGDIKINAAAGAVEVLKTYKGNTEEFNAYSYYINNQDLQTAIGADGDKPLILTGVRQCGKTYIVNEFARKNFESYVYVNYESDETSLKYFCEKKRELHIVCAGVTIVNRRYFVFCN